MQCNAMHRAKEREDDKAMAPVGETEFVQGIAAMSNAGLYGPCEIAAGIVSTADLTLGADIEPVLRAHMAAGRNFRGIRYLGGRVEQLPFADPKVKDACDVLAKLGLSLDCNGARTAPAARAKRHLPDRSASAQGRRRTHWTSTTSYAV